MGKKVIPVVTTPESGATTQRPLALIRILHADGQIEERNLEIGRYDVGRTATDIILPGDRSVSRLHARLDVTASEVTITDLGSTSGTFDARGKRLDSTRSLAPNDSVRIGSAVLSVIRLAIPTPSGVLRGARSTQPAMPEAGKRGVTLPAIPAAMRRGTPGEGAKETADAPPSRRESEPAISGSRPTKSRKKSDKPPKGDQ